MEKKFSKIEINTIKSIAKNVAPYVAKREKVEAQIQEVEEKVAAAIRKRAAEKIEKLNAEKQSYMDVIESMNETVRKMTGGYTTDDLILCVKEGTGKTDDKGREIMQTRYTLKYPETVIPVATEEVAEVAEEEVIDEPVEEVEMTEEELVAVDNEAADDPFNEGGIWQ